MSLTRDVNAEEIQHLVLPVQPNAGGIRGSRVGRPNRFRSARGFVATAITLLSLFLLARHSDLPSVDALSSMTDFRLLAVAVLVNTAGLIAKALRWQALYPAEQRLPLRLATSALAVGQVANWALPTRVGEVVRVGMVTADAAGRSLKRGIAVAAAIIVGEKLIDTVMLGLTVVVLMLFGLPAWLSWTGYVLAAIFCGVLALGVLLRAVQRSNFAPPRSVRLAYNLTPSKIRNLLSEAFIVRDVAFAWLRNGRFAAVTLWSIVAWSLGVLVNYVVMLSLGIDQGLGASLAVLVALYGGMAIPSLPGRLGVFQYLGVLALAPFAVGSQEAVAYSLALYVVVYLPCAALGLLSVVILHSPLRWLIPTGPGAPNA